MFTEIFLPILSLSTLLAVAVFAYIGSQKTIERMESDNKKKSTLAADAKSDGKPVDV